MTSSPSLRARAKTSSRMMPVYSTPSTPAISSQPRPKPNLTDLTISTPSSSKSSLERTPGPSRWRTTEYKIYGIIFALVVPLMIYIPINYSSRTNPNYQLYAWRLSPGWMLGWKVDNSDHQYRTFRSGLPSLLLLGTVHLIASHLSKLVISSTQARLTFIATLSVLVVFVLHGLSAVKILVILGANFFAAKSVKPVWLDKLWPGLVIAGNMGILLLNERYSGYHFSALHPIFDTLDEISGVLPRWHVNFNITMLRIVSFTLDYHWRTPANSQTNAEAPADHRSRVTRPLPDDMYGLINYVAYCLYPPLYIAGPIMTFNDFIWQQRQPLTITIREKISYAIRFAACLLTMEAILHTMYVVAIKDASAWEGAGPAQLSMIGFWNLVVVWLKLLIPWRFFRLWALLDGVDPPENMIRCVANNYSTLGFWRSWHRSYNLWVVRYIYVPLGGAKNAIPATVLVFTFVALWHDLSFKLLAWGWLVSLFVLPELFARRLAPEQKYGHKPWYRHLAACGGVCNVLMMMSANLVGFVLGLEGMKHLVVKLVSTPSGWLFAVFAASCLFVGVQIMFEYREEELRRGIDRKC